jgi:hypothetical protein
MFVFWPGLVYSQDSGSIFNTKSERLGYYHRQGNRIEIFDKSWERKGYIILNDHGKDYFDQSHNRISPDKLLQGLEQ